MLEKIVDSRAHDKPDAPAMERGVRDFLLAAGVDLDDPHLADTPQRVARMYREELLSGYDVDVAGLFTTFDEQYEDLVVLRGLRFHSLCAHHLLPFRGVASIAYQPKGRILGLSKLGRVLDCYARRLQVQERLAAQVADALYTHLAPLGVLVVLDAEHLCMSMRGVHQPDTQVTCSAARGTFHEDRPLAERIMRTLQARG